jgi:starch synthase
MGCFVGYDEARAHRLMAGADLIAVPSRFEPCGLTQLYGLRYGTLPLVRRTGGLADTVADAELGAVAGVDGEGTGFVFDAPEAGALTGALHRVRKAWDDRPRWLSLQQRVMRCDFSWEGPVKAYQDLYDSLRPV